jgi:hypothetical protein
VDVLGAEYEIGEGEGLEESDVCVSTEDSDGDGLSDCMEALLGTDPFHQDSDRYGIPDGQEIQDGTDPTNPASQGHGTQNTMNAQDCFSQALLSRNCAQEPFHTTPHGRFYGKG